MVAFLSRPETYDPPAGRIERMDTHSAHVFLAGDHAYKIKRAVRYSFLDFSTLEKRHAACLNELRVNRRTAPDLYLEVLPITAGPQGGLRLGGEGAPVEWVLKMRRFEQSALLDHMAEEGSLDLALMGPLADAIRAFHVHAPRFLQPEGGVAGLASVIAGNDETLFGEPDIYEPEAARAFSAACRERLEALAPLLRKRAQAGFVRHCHGDLHLRNIVLQEGRPVLFDAIEFDDQLATVDVLYDLAFLLMDLWFRGLTRHANRVLNRYLSWGGTSNLRGLAALPLFLALRAMIRSKADALRAAACDEDAERRGAVGEARAYFDLAQSLIHPPAPVFVAIGGLSGTGKTTLARALAPGLGPAPGAVHLRSDVERKRLFGKDDVESLGEEAYTPAVTNLVYAVLRKKAAMVATARHGVIVDAVHGTPEERAGIEQIASRHGMAFVGLWLTAPEEALLSRVRERSADASDADERVVKMQLRYDIGPVDWQQISADRPFEEIVADCAARINAAS